jgi:uncharacterized protein YecE (DUF72 family)
MSEKSDRRPESAGLRVGCSGWNYEHWRNRVFYPPRLPQRKWLAFYAERFDTVEVNATFYRLPDRSTVERWARETPEGFLFAVKASRYLTHVKRLRDVEGGVTRFMTRIGSLLDAGKVGPILWQLPPNLERDDALLAATLGVLPDSARHAFEFRHPSWFDDEVASVLRTHNAALVVAHRAGSPDLTRTQLTADFVYLRFHAGPGDGNYSHSQLGRWRRRLREWAGDRDVYAYFNNDWCGYAIENAAVLRDGPSRPSRSSAQI